MWNKIISKLFQPSSTFDWDNFIRPRRSRGAAAYSDQTYPWTICRSVGLSSALWKTADRIRMPFAIIGGTGLGMRQVVVFGDRSTGRGTFGGEFGAHHCNQWGLYGVRVRQRRDAGLFPNYFGQTCFSAWKLAWSYFKIIPEAYCSSRIFSNTFNVIN